MGTTLTGTTPQDTYDSLIKVTDNGPISATVKYLSDGLGNDSVLALSTTAVGIGTASPSTYGANLAVLGSGNGIVSVGQATSFATLQSNGQDFYINTKGTGNFILRNGSGDTERMRITSAGNVGIGTSAPTSLLHLEKAAQDNVLAVVGQDTYEGALFLSSAGSGKDANIVIGNSRSLIFYSTANSTPAARGTRILTIDSQGIKFGTDTAAANALDDYEEGSWTPTYQGGITGATYSNTQGRYTKIGNAVHWRARIQATAGTAAASQVIIGGFPFTSASAPESAGSVGYFTIYTTDVVYMYNEANTTSIAAFYKKDGNALIGTDLTLLSGTIHCSGTYFV